MSAIFKYILIIIAVFNECNGTKSTIYNCCNLINAPDSGFLQTQVDESILSCIESFSSRSQENIRKLFNGTDCDTSCVLDKNNPSDFSINLHLVALTYYTKNIREHALLAYAINTAYFESESSLQYFPYRSLILLSPESGHEVNTDDQRWNKVYIFTDLLNKVISGRTFDKRNILSTSTEQSSSEMYLIWLDSDLIIANHSFRFDQLIRQKQKSHFDTFGINADLILSKEINLDNGIANSGAMIVRVSNWSKQFFEHWRDDWLDKTIAMDQHAFDYLYHNNPELDCKRHIILLDPNEINSIFPGLTNHKNSDPILHLAGETNFVRSYVFKRSWESLCLKHLGTENKDQLSIRTEKDSLWPPDGISRHSLDSIDYISLHKKQWNGIIQSLSHRLITLESIRQLRYEIREAQQSLSRFICSFYKNDSSAPVSFILESLDMNQLILDQNQCSSLQNIFLNETISALRFAYVSYRALISTNQPSATLLQDQLDAGFELATVAYFDSLDDSFLVLMEELNHIVQSLVLLVDKNSFHILLYYKFKIAEYIGQYHEEHLSPHHAIEAYKEALSIWNEMTSKFKYFGSGNGLLHSYREGIRTVKRLLKQICFASQEMELNILEYIQVGKSWVQKDNSESNHVDIEIKSLVEIFLGGVNSTALTSLQISSLELYLLESKCISTLSLPREALLYKSDSACESEMNSLKRNFDVLNYQSGIILCHLLQITLASHVTATKRFKKRKKVYSYNSE